jgi:hypothetical protein
LNRAGAPGGCLDAVAGVWMRGEPGWKRTPPADRLETTKCGEEIADVADVVPRREHVPEAQVVRLALGVRSIFGEKQTGAGRGAPVEGAQLRNRYGPDSDLRSGGPGERLHTVSRVYVRDLVREDGCQLGLRVEDAKNAARDENKAAGQGEGVRHRIVRDAERPRELGPVRFGGQARPHLLYVVLKRLIGDESEYSRGFTGRPLSNADLLPFGQEARAEQVGRAPRHASAAGERTNAGYG